jgi:CRP/FNR family transcriptional regulator, cyclic AMP receptor protein
MAHSTPVVPKLQRAKQSTLTVKSPHGWESIKVLPTSPPLKGQPSYNLPRRVIDRFEAIASAVAYPKGAALFVEGQEPRGVFVICGGRVKLSTSSPAGKTLILRVAEPGDVVGLPGLMSGRPYEATAEALEPIEARLVLRRDFVQFLEEHSEAAIWMAEILNSILRAAYQEVRYLGLCNSAAEKLARFLLNVAAKDRDKSSENDGPPHVRLNFTHEEIAQTVGLSRETVTRLFGDFRRKRLVEVGGSALIVLNSVGLKKIAGT